VEGEAVEIEKRSAALQAELAKGREERERIASQVEPEVLRRYGAIRMRRGLAVVAVSEGTCLGCHMNIPPQLYNQLQRTDTILTCPQCYRIIYWDRLMEEPKAEPIEEKAGEVEDGQG